MHPATCYPTSVCEQCSLGWRHYIAERDCRWKSLFTRQDTSGSLVSVNWTFFLYRCYGWGATSEYRFKIGDFAPTGPVDPKFHVEGVAPTNHSSSQKTRLNDLSCGVKIWTSHSSVLSKCTRLTDRQTDRQLSHLQTASAFPAARWNR